MLASLLLLTTLAPEVTLSGVVLARSGRHAATLMSGGRARPVIAGDRAFGCEVAAIREGQVDIICGGERRTLSIAPSTPPYAANKALEAAGADAPPADVTMTRVEKEGTHKVGKPVMVKKTVEQKYCEMVAYQTTVKVAVAVPAPCPAPCATTCASTCADPCSTPRKGLFHKCCK